MSMRERKRALMATTLQAWVPPTGAETALLQTLTQVRQARVALLRQPGALAELRASINALRGPGRKVLRKMLAEDIRLMRLLDRQKPAVNP